MSTTEIQQEKERLEKLIFDGKRKQTSKDCTVRQFSEIEKEIKKHRKTIAELAAREVATN